MNRRIFAAFAACILGLSLCGCQLALPEKPNTEDKLCGFFITFSAIPSPANEPEKTFRSMKELEEHLNTPARVYATPHAGQRGSDTPEYMFENVKGIRFFELHVKENESSYYTSQMDAGIEDVHINVGDNSMELTGTLLIDIRANRTIFANPVYTASDGRVYAVQGSGLSYGGRTDAGDWGSTSISQTRKQTANGEEKTETYKMELNIKGVYPLQKAVLKRMSANDTLLGQTQITKEITPDSILLDAETAYSILEEYRLDADGSIVLERSLIKNDATDFTCIFSGEQGFMDTRVIKLEKSTPSV